MTYTAVAAVYAAALGCKSKNGITLSDPQVSTRMPMGRSQSCCQSDQVSLGLTVLHRCLTVLADAQFGEQCNGGSVSGG